MPKTPLMKFEVPEAIEVEGYAVEMPDGTIELRTREQLEAMPQEEKESGGQ